MILILLSFLMLSYPCGAQESPLTLTDMTAVPGVVAPGERVLISCRVTHPEGATSIKRVAATVYRKDRNTTYPALYDDGTNGDEVAGDGIYSLEITAGFEPGEEKIVFTAVDRGGNEIESKPLILEIR